MGIETHAPSYVDIVPSIRTKYMATQDIHVHAREFLHRPLMPVERKIGKPGRGIWTLFDVERIKRNQSIDPGGILMESPTFYPP